MPAPLLHYAYMRFISLSNASGPPTIFAIGLLPHIVLFPMSSYCAWLFLDVAIVTDIWSNPREAKSCLCLEKVMRKTRVFSHYLAFPPPKAIAQGTTKQEVSERSPCQSDCHSKSISTGYRYMMQVHNLLHIAVSISICCIQYAAGDMALNDN